MTTQEHKSTRAQYSLILAGLALVAVLTTCRGPTTGAAGPLPTTDPGPRWQQATATAAFGPIASHTSLVFAPSGQTEPRLWVIGGRSGGYQDKVWSSADGLSWVEAAKNTDSTKRFSARYRHTSLVFKGQMWVIGGSGGSAKNDVWSSGDGADWTEAAKSTDDTKRFSARNGHSSLVFKDPADGTDKMWVLGGNADTLKNDVWSSADGKDWSQVTAAAKWSPRWLHRSLVFKDPLDGTDKMWVLGGFGGGIGDLNDVWSSADGKAWSQASAAKWSARHSHSSLVFTDPADGLSKMWVLGGERPSSLGENDVWWSADGQSWTQARLADWSARRYHSSVVFKDKLWVIGGTGQDYYSDVWYYPDSPAIVPVVSPAAGSNPAAIANPAAAANPASP